MNLSGLLITSSIIACFAVFQVQSQFINNFNTPSVSFPEHSQQYQTPDKLTDFLYPDGNDFSAISVLIIESKSFNNGHVMDTIWKYVAQGMGMTATIGQQTALDDTAFFSTTGLLIISSGVINIPSNRIDNIKSFLMRGRNVYLQCEYLSTYQSNLAFLSIVNNLGGVFNWGSTVSGDLQPMQILGTLSTTPNNVPSLSYFWYGVYGTGNNTIEYFMRYQGNNFGFIFRPPNINYGKMIANSDQDWVNHMTSIPLMQNILTMLGSIIGIHPISNEIPESYSLEQNYPNPFNPATKIKFKISNPKSETNSKTEIKIYDLIGSEVAVLVNEELIPGTYEVEWDASKYSSGVYFYTIQSGEYKQTKKMMLIK